MPQPSAYSITLSPTHRCIPQLADFLIERAENPLPEQAELIQLMQHLNVMDIRQFNVRVKSGMWAVEFVVNENRKYLGAAKCFAGAVEDALTEVHKTHLN